MSDTWQTPLDKWTITIISANRHRDEGGDDACIADLADYAAALEAENAADGAQSEGNERT